MDKKMKTILWILVFAVFIGAAVFAYHSLSGGVMPQNSIGAADKNPEPAETNDGGKNEKMKAPDFTVLDANGSEVKLSDLFGKPIVLNFWASWCPPCKGEMPEFDKVFAELGDDVQFMMVDMTDGQRETVEKATKYVEDMGYSFPVYFDTKQDAAYTYGVQSIPSTLFIDKDGYIVTGAKGAIEEDTLRRGIDLIQQKE